MITTNKHKALGWTFLCSENRGFNLWTREDVEGYFQFTTEEEAERRRDLLSALKDLILNCFHVKPISIIINNKFHEFSFCCFVSHLRARNIIFLH